MYNFLFFIFLFVTGIQIAYWLFIFSKLAFYKEDSPTLQEEVRPVSIVICAKNEANNLSKFLHHFLSQSYRFFEIIVVNDNSSDNSLEILLDFQMKNTNLCIVNVSGTSNLPGKKYALSKGIEAASFEILLLTDADCIPSSPYWIQSMQSKIIEPSDEIVLGYSPYKSENGFLNLFIQFETTFTAIQYLSFALLGFPYMGVGRNLLYKKSLFYNKGAFSKHANIASGDDDLFINEAAIRTNTKVNLDPKSFIISLPKSTWRDYYHQKTRHLSTGIHYQFRHKVLLGMYSLTHFLHYFLGIAMLFESNFAEITFLIILVRIGVVLLFFGFILNKFQNTNLLRWIPVLDAFYVLYYIVFSPTFIIGNKNKWK